MNLIYKLVTLTSSIPIPDSIKTSGTMKNVLGWLTGKGDVTTQNSVIGFYKAWSETLGPSADYMLTVGYGLGSFFTKIFYNIGLVLAAVYAKMFGLLGFLIKGDYAGASKVENLHSFLVILGFSLLVLGIIGWAVASMFKRPDFKDAMVSVITACSVIIILPWLLGQFNSITVHATTDMNTAVMGAKSTSFEESLKKVVLSPLKDNTIDWLDMADQNFNTNPNKIGGSKGWGNYNRLKTDNINSINFTVNIAQDNIGYVADNHKNNTNVFKYQLDMGASDGRDTKVIKLALPATQVSGITHMTQQVYPRYHVNWLAVIAELILLDAFFLLAGYKVAKYNIKIFFLMLLSPLVALFRVQSLKNVKELMSAIIGAFTGIFVENASVFFLITVIQVTSGTSNFIGGLASGWARVIATLFIYGACFAVLISGDQYIQRWSGTSAGQAGSMREIVAGSMAGAGLANLTGKTAKKAVQGIGAAASAATSAGKGMKNVGSKLKDGVDQLRSSALQDESENAGETDSSDGQGDKFNAAKGTADDDTSPSPSEDAANDAGRDANPDSQQTAQPQNDQPGNAAADNPEDGQFNGDGVENDANSDAGIDDLDNPDMASSDNFNQNDETISDPDAPVTPGLDSPNDGFDYQEGMESLDATEPPATDSGNINTQGTSGSESGVENGPTSPTNTTGSAVPSGTGNLDSVSASSTASVPNLTSGDQAESANEIGRAAVAEGENAASAGNTAGDTATPVNVGTAPDASVNAAAGQPATPASTTTTSNSSHLVNVRPVATTAGSGKQPPIIPAKHYASSAGTRPAVQQPRLSARANQSAVPKNLKINRPDLPDLPTPPTAESSSAGRVTNFNNIPD